MSSEDEEDGPMSTETYQRLNENWELRYVPNQTQESKVSVGNNLVKLWAGLE